MAAANNEFFEALSMLEHERGITAEYLIEKIKAAIVIAVKKNYEVEDDHVMVEIDPDTGKFNVALTEILTGTAPKLDTYHLVRRGETEEVERFPGYHYEDMASRYARKIMQPLLVILDPCDEPAELVCHDGQEFNYVLEGSLILTFGDRDIQLNAGDSIYFNPTYPHGQRCNGDVPCKFITIIAE